MLSTYLKNLLKNPYYKDLLLVREIVSNSCDKFFEQKRGVKVDLYLITNSVSSPIALGSDSKPLPIKFGSQNAMLADSSQFGMEPLLITHFKMVYCYLPSFRGEKPDDEHLNQFFHCEAEMRGKLDDAIKLSEGLARKLANDIAAAYKQKRVHFNKFYSKHLTDFGKSKGLPQITFDEGFELLSKQKDHNLLVKTKPYGRIFTRLGEKRLVKIVTNNSLPVWVKYYDRDSVPFYQKPNPANPESTLNADLLFPSVNGGFGGEIIGAGQRQDDIKEIKASLRKQNVQKPERYDWYIDLRKQKGYSSTAGFGLGIERFLAWALCKHSISDVIICPRTLGGSLNP